MELKVIYKNARCAVIEIEDGGRYHTASSWTIYLNHKEAAKTDKAVTSLYHLTPDTQYEVEAVREFRIGLLHFCLKRHHALHGVSCRLKVNRRRIELIFV